MSTHFPTLVEQTANQVIAKALNTTSQEEATSILWDKLKELGITKENVDSHALISDGFVKEGDARAVFCEGNPPTLPVPWFRKLWTSLLVALNPTTILEDVTQSSTGRIVDAIRTTLSSNRPVSQWKDLELVQSYGVDSPSEVVDEMKKRSQGKAIIAFEDESTGKVNVDVTFEMMRESRRRKLPELYNQGGKLYKLHVVGDFPSAIYEESPLVEGSLLFNGYCDKCEMDFTGISKEARQFLRVVIEEGQAPKITDRMALLGLLTAAKNGIGELRNLFPSVSIRFDELQRKEELPSLKADASVERPTSRNSDPLGNVRH